MNRRATAGVQFSHAGGHQLVPRDAGPAVGSPVAVLHARRPGHAEIGGATSDIVGNVGGAHDEQANIGMVVGMISLWPVRVLSMPAADEQRQGIVARNWPRTRGVMVSTKGEIHKSKCDLGAEQPSSSHQPRPDGR